MGIPRSSLYHRMKVTLSCTLGMLISHGRLTLELARAVMTVTLPPENKTNLKTFFFSLNAVFNYNFELDTTVTLYCLVCDNFLGGFRQGGNSKKR